MSATVPPPQSLYRRFIEEIELEYKSTVVYVSFRDKQTGGWNPSTTIKLADGRVIFKKRTDSPYMNAFLSIMSLRPSCGSCKYATLPRQGDLTMADFWGVRHYKEKLDDKKGTSAVLINNEKGERLLQALKERALSIEAVPLAHAVKYNPQIKHSSVHHPHRKYFLSLARDKHFPLEKAVHDAKSRHFDIGYVGWWYGNNYGSVLTSFAMNRVLRRLGKTVLMLDFPYLPGQSDAKQDSAARRFARHFYETSARRRIDKHGDLNTYCDAFLVGSDQLWNWWCNDPLGTDYYFLDFADSKHKKIAYATSFGHEKGYYPENKRIRVSQLLHRFDAISVREHSGVDICSHNFGVEAELVLDPVFLCSLKDYKEAVSLSKVMVKKAYLLAYILDYDEEKLKTIRYAAEKMGIPYYIIIDGQKKGKEHWDEVNDPNVIDNLEIVDWLAYFYNATYLVTDSYHGFCFGAIFSKQMVVYPNVRRGKARFDTLGKITGLNSRFVESHKEVLERNLLETPVNFAAVDEKLNPEIEKSRTWLKNALAADRKIESAEALALGKIAEYGAEIERLKKELSRLKGEFGKA